MLLAVLLMLKLTLSLVMKSLANGGDEFINFFKGAEAFLVV